VLTLSGKNYSVQYLLLEQCRNGTLGKIIRRTGALEENLARVLFLQLVTAVKFIHKKGFAHMDIKLENILLDDYFNAKLSDLGTATYVVDNFGYTSREVGTRGYMGPEILAKDTRDDNFDAWAADVYSLGVCLNLLLTGEFPCQEQFDNFFETGDSEMEDEGLSELTLSDTTNDKPKYVMTGNSKIDKFNLLSESAQNLLDDMLSEDP